MGEGKVQALWETGLVFNLGHGGNPCPGLAVIDDEENRRQDVIWEGYVTRQRCGASDIADEHSTGGRSESALPSGSDAGPNTDFSAPADLDLRMQAAAEDIFHDNGDVENEDNEEFQKDEGYDSDPIDDLVDPEEPDNDIVNDHNNDRDDSFTSKYHERM